eukprot:11186851-Lingulodinium_polyedra.AAC.1
MRQRGGLQIARVRSPCVRQFSGARVTRASARFASRRVGAIQSSTACSAQSAPEQRAALSQQP